MRYWQRAGMRNFAKPAALPRTRVFPRADLRGIENALLVGVAKITSTEMCIPSLGKPSQFREQIVPNESEPALTLMCPFNRNLSELTGARQLSRP